MAIVLLALTVNAPVPISGLLVPVGAFSVNADVEPAWRVRPLVKIRPLTVPALAMVPLPATTAAPPEFVMVFVVPAAGAKMPLIVIVLDTVKLPESVTLAPVFTVRLAKARFPVLLIVEFKDELPIVIGPEAAKLPVTVRLPLMTAPLAVVLALLKPLAIVKLP